MATMPKRPLHLQLQWERLPTTLQNKLDHCWHIWSEKHAILLKDLPDHPTFWRGLTNVWLSSHYLFTQTLEHPKQLLTEFYQGHLFASLAEDYYDQILNKQTKDCKDTTELKRTLRLFKQQAMMRIGWRDLNGLACFQETAHDLSNLAMACIRACCTWLECDLAHKHGKPEAYKGATQSLMVIAMGKLGGGELNVSSDVDLMFAYPQDGQTCDEQHPLSHQAYFTQIAQSLCNLLMDNTQDGHLYRVDIRLRPHGPSGPLALSYQALERYYQTSGQEWERYALIKANPITGQLAARRALMHILQAFTYRQYIDISALQSLRSLYQRIVKQHHQNDPNHLNIKLGSGGIRDIEFIVHSDQLMHGGNHYALRTPCLMDALNTMRAENLIDETNAKMLYRFYVFLRHIENRLQYDHNQQTHLLPTTPEKQAQLAFSMHFKNWEELHKSIVHHTHTIHTLLEQTLAPKSNPPSSITTHKQNHPILQALVALYPENADADNTLARLQSIIKEAKLSSHQTTIAMQLLASMLEQALKQDQPKDALATVEKLLTLTLNYPPYLMLLHEHHTTLSSMIELTYQSALLLSMVEQHPSLLVEMIHLRRTLQSPLHLLVLNNKLKRIIDNTPNITLQEQIENLIHFKHVHVFRAAILYQMGHIDIMRLADHLTNIATATLMHAFELAKLHTPNTTHTKHDLGIIAYGKLGSIEMSFQSDLDLVFVCQSQSSGTDFSTYYTQLYQTLLSILAPTHLARPLYEVDLRLRPMGKTGALIHNLDSLSTYLQTHAWTWEHQALIKARMIIGSTRLKHHFERIRTTALDRFKKSLNDMTQDIAKMRKLMRQENRLSKDSLFDLKQSPGGIIDIEFITQYYVLKHSAKHPTLLNYTDNIRLLSELKNLKIISEEAHQTLTQNFLTLRKILVDNELKCLPAILAEAPTHPELKATVKLWEDLFEKDGVTVN